MENPVADKPRKPDIKINCAVDLYLFNRSNAINCESEYMSYKQIVENIKNGIAILSDEFPELNKRVDSVLNSATAYFSKYNIKYDNTSAYSIAEGNDDIGRIVVRVEEVEFAERVLKEQMASLLIRRLSPLDRDIFKTLIKSGYIKKQSLEDDMMSKIMRDMDGQ